MKRYAFIYYICVISKTLALRGDVILPPNKLPGAYLGQQCLYFPQLLWNPKSLNPLTCNLRNAKGQIKWNFFYYLEFSGSKDKREVVEGRPNLCSYFKRFQASYSDISHAHREQRAKSNWWSGNEAGGLKQTLAGHDWLPPDPTISISDKPAGQKEFTQAGLHSPGVQSSHCEECILLLRNISLDVPFVSLYGF